MASVNANGPVTNGPRVVPAFTIQANQKNTTTTAKPLTPNMAVQRKSKNCSTDFRRRYDQTDLPIRLGHEFSGHSVTWLTPFESLDFDELLPLFVDGLAEINHPHAFLAQKGLDDLMDHATPELVSSALPYMIQPLRRAMNSHNAAVMRKGLKVIKRLAGDFPGVGEMLIPYYRQLLNPLRLLSAQKIDGTKDNAALTTLVDETLRVLERNGGPNAFINIKYMIPTYHSSMGNH